MKIEQLEEYCNAYEVIKGSELEPFVDDCIIQIAWREMAHFIIANAEQFVKGIDAAEILESEEHKNDVVMYLLSQLYEYCIDKAEEEE